MGGPWGASVPSPCSWVHPFALGFSLEMGGERGNGGSLVWSCWEMQEPQGSWSLSSGWRVSAGDGDKDGRGDGHWGQPGPE